MNKPKIAIIGRPNVGKSTLFNRLTGTKKALVHDKPGLTRDRKEEDAEIGDLKFTLIDTAGLENIKNLKNVTNLEALMREQTLLAAKEAEIILFMIDGKAGLLPDDEYFAKQVRKYGKPTLLLINKTESAKRVKDTYEPFKLGFGEPILTSAEHGIGMGEIYDAIVSILKEKNKLEDGLSEEEENKHDIDNFTLAIIGRPNAGKSTLFNRIIGENRAITSNIAGTTRDSVYKDFEFDGHKIKLVDTAGIRKKFKKGDFLEEISVQDSIESLKFANIAVLLIDATIGIDRIELQLVDLIFTEGKGLVIGLNKWDSATKEQKDEIIETLNDKFEYSLSQAKTSKYLQVSALYGTNNKALIREAITTYENWNKRISTAKLNDWLKIATDENIPPICGGKRVKLKYMTQVKSRPPTFSIFTSSSLKNFPNSYNRYLINNLRESFEIYGVPIRLNIRKTNNPYDH